MFYRIGLDIGITSVGWCAVETYENGEPKRILSLGTRIFDAAENPKDGAPLAEPRRQARGLRRRLRRRAFRLMLARELFAAHGVTPNAAPHDVNELRAAGLDRLLEPREFAAVLMLLIKRRGYKSNSKALKDKEEGELLSAVRSNSQHMSEKGYRTAGEMLAAECVEKRTGADGCEYVVYNTRNKGGGYARTFLRSDIRAEIETLFEAQTRYGNSLATEEVRDGILHIFDMQRNFDDGPGKGSPYSASYAVGKCEFEPQEERAPKASLSFELFTAYQKINHLRIAGAKDTRALTDAEREKAVALVLKNKKITYAALRKALGLGAGERFNALTYSSKKKGDEQPSEEDVVKDTEKAVFVSLERSRAILDALSEEHRTRPVADAAAYVLSHVKSDKRRTEMFASLPETANLSDEEKENLLKLTCDKFGHLSVKAINNILPYLEKGYRYDEACKEYGYNHSQRDGGEKRVLLKGEDIRREIEEINSPVVRRSVSQTLKVLNALILKYGSPVAVTIELAREMGKSREERDKENRENLGRKKTNDALRDEIREKYGLNPTHMRLVIRKLYDEQVGRCPYTGEVIDANRLYEDNYVQVDHIIPYSRSFNDSFTNKVLVKTRANQEKGNKTPFEWLFTTPQWNDFFDRVSVMYAGNFKKRQLLLKESFDEDEWKSRALNDTRYICRYMLGLLQDKLMFAQSEVGKKKVTAVNGGITAELRRQWGIGKVREDGDIHHAVDAAVIACVTAGAVQKLSTAYKFKHEEKRYDAPGFGADIAEPYKGFSEELAARCLADEDVMHERLRALGFDEETVAAAKSVFVSRMPKRKGKGPIHKETILGAKYVRNEGVAVKKVPITSLKLDKDKNTGEYYIKDYFRPQDDKTTYDILLERLVAADGKAEVAFKDKVYKPAAEGKTPNEIKKVKVTEPVNSGVVLDGIQGFAANGSMVRVDIFSKGGKYYCVPVYTADIYAGRLPDRAATAGKKFEEWDVMDETYKFEFALYPNDLIWIKHKSGISMAKQRDNADSRMPDTYEMKEGFVYFKALNISSACATIITNNNCYVKESLGLKTLGALKKCNVDVLGNVSFVKGERRPPASMKK